MKFRELLGLIDTHGRLIIQTHNFPDHDAVAAAFGLQGLFRKHGITATLCYGGHFQSRSLAESVDWLGIPLVSCGVLEGLTNLQIILVDGNAGNRNVTALGGTLIGIIDHHQPTSGLDVPFRDIRPDYGSCSTIIYEYYKDEGYEPDRNTATALLMGIMMDTGFLTRGVSEADLTAFSRLFFAGDWEAGSSLLKNSISVDDLPVFEHAIESRIIEKDVCFIFLDRSCSAELTAIVADFFLRLREVNFVVVVNDGDDEYTLSVRSEDGKRPADLILQKALSGIGSGGGHVFMSGGSISRDRFPGRQEIIEKFLTAALQIRASFH